MMSQKSKEAKCRNWRIRALRGMYAQVGILFQDPFRTTVREAVEEQLLREGAETMKERAEKELLQCDE